MAINSFYTALHPALAAVDPSVSVDQAGALNWILRGSPYVAAFLIIIVVVYVIIRQFRQIASGQHSGCHCGSQMNQNNQDSGKQDLEALSGQINLMKCQNCKRSLQRSESRRSKQPAERV